MQVTLRLVCLRIDLVEVIEVKQRGNVNALLVNRMEEFTCMNVEAREVVISAVTTLTNMANAGVTGVIT